MTVEFCAEGDCMRHGLLSVAAALCFFASASAEEVPVKPDRASTFTIDWPTPPKRTDTQLSGTQVWLTDMTSGTRTLGFLVRVMDFRALSNAKASDTNPAGLAQLMAKTPLEDPDEVSSSAFPVPGGYGTETVAEENGLFIRTRGYGFTFLGYAVSVTSRDPGGIRSAEAEKFFSSFHPLP